MIEKRLDWPKVSVVIPTRDRPTLLERAVRSVLAQDYPGAVECLVVFDQSPVVPVSVQYNSWDRELRFLRNSRSPGVSGARNSGALVAKGELISFCDDDDEWLPGKARKQVKMLTAMDHATVACGIYVRAGGRDITRFAPAFTSYANLLRNFPMELNSSTWMLHRADFVELMYDEKMRYAEDCEWLLRVARKMKIVALHEPLVRIHWDRRSWVVGRWRYVAEDLSYLVEKHPELQNDHFGLARIYSEIAFAYAALGRKTEARRWLREALSLNWLEIRAYLTLLVLSGVVGPSTIFRTINFFGRGI